MPMFIPLAIAVAAELGTMAIVGAALSAVGGLVGSKELSMIGGLVGLAGGAIGGDGIAGLGTDEAAVGLAADEMTGSAAQAATQSAAETIAPAQSTPENVLKGSDVAGDAVSASPLDPSSMAQQNLAGAPDAANPSNLTAPNELAGDGWLWQELAGDGRKRGWKRGWARISRRPSQQCTRRPHRQLPFGGRHDR